MPQKIPTFVAALFAAFASNFSVAAAEDKFPSFPAVPPAEVGKTFRVKNGFTLDLVAAEPLVSSPVAICYDENGAAYVAEMRDYPYTDRTTHVAWKDNTTDAPIGRIRKLIDRDGDGVFDESYIFADGLSWPTGVACWNGGIIVTATPDVWFLKDTDGDHRADVREKVFSGFRKYNIQAVINTPLWSLDNHIIFTGGTNGAQLVSERAAGEKPLRIARNDLRVDPRTWRIEPIAGGARFGQGIDDWGNRFLCNIRNPAQHVVFDGILAGRNPLLAAPNPVFDVRESGDQLPVMRISPIEPWREFRARRWVAENHAVPRSELVAGGVYTSAAGITVYRGAAYPPEYRGQIFTAEVANNLVQRQSVARDGVTFKVETADKDAEFIASTDLWFRPVNFANAPDGTLHVVDMYRETIEHPWSIPDDIHAKLDLESGRDRGRIYRLTPPGFKNPKPPRLGAASTAELVATLENPNGWWRDTAQRLLFERQDPAAVAPLRALLEKSTNELARLHALYALDGLRTSDGSLVLRDEDLLLALGDRSAGVREHAVRLAAQTLALVRGSTVPSENGGQARFVSSPLAPQLRTRVLALAADPEIRVRYQVAFAAGGIANDPAAVTAAVAILRQSPDDRWVRAAVLGAPPDQCARIAQAWLAAGLAMTDGETLRQFAFVAGAQNTSANIDALFAAARDAGALTDVFWSGLGDGLRQAGKNFSSALRGTAAQSAAVLLAGAARTARTATADSAARVAAVKLLGYDDFPGARPVLAALLAPSEAPPVQIAAVKALASFAHADVAKTLLGAWPGCTPSVREEVIAALLARRERIAPLLTAMENNVVSPGQVSTARRTQLLATTDAALKARAQKIFGQGPSASRAEVVRTYQPVIGMTGSAARGSKTYDAVCAACHRYGGRGTDLGPNLETIRGWDKEKLLLHILDPNREVASAYLAYAIELKDGGIITGMITEETAGGIKVKRMGAPEETILRQNITKLTSSALSLMPEGLESALPPADMADLLAYLTAP